ncbi:hypothetical protein EMCRGX_G002146 [Ephydatia muelleri]
MWTLFPHTETEAVVFEELKLDIMVQSLCRVTLLKVVNKLIATSAGSLACVAEYESPNIQIDLASSPKFLEQIEGALQSIPASFRNIYLLAMSLLTALAYNLDTHRYLCKSHVIQSIIRTWKNADPTPENNATRGESIYLNSDSQDADSDDVDMGDECTIPSFIDDGTVILPSCSDPVLMPIVEKYRELFRKCPGRTDVGEHHIPTQETQ